MRHHLVSLVFVATGLFGCALPGEVDDPLADPAPPDGAADGASSRASWVRRQITLWNEGLSAADRTAKYGRMAESSYAFYRGSNHLFWSQYARDSRLSSFGNVAATRTWLQGDLHPDNMGSFDDDRGSLVYDLNDFDEALIADYQLDVWRMAIGIALVAHENGLSKSDGRAAAEAFAEAYLDELHAVHGNTDEVGATFGPAEATGALENFLADVDSSESRATMLAEWTRLSSGVRVFDSSNTDLAAVTSARRAEIIAAMPAYGQTLTGGLAWNARYFAVKSVAQRLNAGIGSFGMTRYYVLIEGPSSSQSDDVILDVKLQSDPTGYHFVTATLRRLLDSSFAGGGERVATAQRGLLAQTDDHVGYLDLASGSYSVRTRSPLKDTLDTSELDDADALTAVAEQWGTILADAHARADRDFDPSLVPGSFDSEVDDRTDGSHSAFRAIVGDVAGAGRDQVLRDYQSFLALAQ